MSARSSGSRSSQRSARFRMLSVATCRRSIDSFERCRRQSPVGAGDRQGERERRAGALLGLDPDPPAVLLDDVAGDRQPETRAAARPGRAPGRPCRSARRSAPGPAFGTPTPVVLDRRRRTSPSVAPRRGPSTSPPSRAELQRVVDEVDDDLAEPRLVAADRRQPARARPTTQAQALAVGEEAEALGRLRGDRARGRRRRGGPAGRRSRSGQGRAAR